jgi:hypothetical protein
LVAVEALLFYPTHLQQELQLAAMVVLAIYSQVELVAHQRLQTQAVLVVVVVDISLLAVMLQVTQAELAEMVAAEAEALTTLEHLVLAVMA